MPSVRLGAVLTTLSEPRWPEVERALTDRAAGSAAADSLPFQSRQLHREQGQCRFRWGRRSGTDKARTSSRLPALPTSRRARIDRDSR